MSGDSSIFAVPNITGAFWPMASAYDQQGANGAFSYVGDINARLSETGSIGIGNYRTVQFVASSSNATYGASGTVQPASRYALMIIKA